MPTRREFQRVSFSNGLAIINELYYEPAVNAASDYTETDESVISRAVKQVERICAVYMHIYVLSAIPESVYTRPALICTMRLNGRYRNVTIYYDLMNNVSRDNVCRERGVSGYKCLRDVRHYSMRSLCEFRGKPRRRRRRRFPVQRAMQRLRNSLADIVAILPFAFFNAVP